MGCVVIIPLLQEGLGEVLTLYLCQRIRISENDIYVTKSMDNKTSNYGDKVKARHLRREMTAAEVSLWKYLKNRTTGYKFRRQHPIGPYVLDFYCYELNLSIELDGDVHNQPMADDRDQIRTDYLNQQGITVLRYSNEVVFRNVENILKSIEHYAANPVFMSGWHKDEVI